MPKFTFIAVLSLFSPGAVLGWNFGLGRSFADIIPWSSTSDGKHVIFQRHSITYMNEHLRKFASFHDKNFSDVFEPELLPKFRDTPLSPRGLELVHRQLQQPSPPPYVSDIDLVVVSPLRRALQTYDMGWKQHVDPSVPVVACPEAAERLLLISDVGTPRSVLEVDFPFVDFSFVGEQEDDEGCWWWSPERSAAMVGPYREWRPTDNGQAYACPAEPQKDFSLRMRRLLQFLEERPELNILVVCHHGVIDWMLDMDFENCQYRRLPFERISRLSRAGRAR